jgi:Carboxypeptidase regulatory-like domain
MSVKPECNMPSNVGSLRPIVIAGVALLILLAANTKSFAQAPYTEVAGQLQDATGAPIVNARVEVFCSGILSGTAKTNTKGKFEVSGSPGANCRFRAKVPGFVTYEQSVPMIFGKYVSLGKIVLQVGHQNRAA